MRILVTGGTGFIGVHTVNKLLDAGYDVSLLIRSEEKMRRLFGDRIEHFVVGDINDEAAIEQALDNCDGVIHIAALVSIDAADEEYIYNTNFNGTKRMIGGAVKRGLKKIIYVSSITAVYDPNAEQMDENSPPGRASKGYGGSKVASEIYVQALQEMGAPIHTTYPAAVIGPDAPALTEAHNGLVLFLNPLAPVFESGNQYVDVRDVAEAHLKLLQSEQPSGRWPLGGYYITWEEHTEMFSEITGRAIRPMKLSSSGMTAAAKVTDWLSNYGINSIVTSESITYATNFVPLINDKVIDELGLEFTPLEQSFEDTLLWLAQAGHIEAKKLGDLAEALAENP